MKNYGSGISKKTTETSIEYFRTVPVFVNMCLSTADTLVLDTNTLGYASSWIRTHWGTHRLGHEYTGVCIVLDTNILGYASSLIRTHWGTHRLGYEYTGVCIVLDTNTLGYASSWIRTHWGKHRL